MDQLPALDQQLEDRLNSIPGVRSASFSRFSPQNGCCMSVDISIGGRSESWIGDTDVISLRVSPHYFETIGTPVLRGRPLLTRTLLPHCMSPSSTRPLPANSSPEAMRLENISASPWLAMATTIKSSAWSRIRCTKVRHPRRCPCTLCPSPRRSNSRRRATPGSKLRRCIPDPFS